MKTIITAVLFLLLFELNVQVTYSQKIDKQLRMPGPVEMLNNSAQGREFWIAIPPNEVLNYSPNVLEIYVTSAKRTMVTLSTPNTGLLISKIVEPMQVTTFSSANTELGWDLEVRESEQITGKGLKLEADQPISVYVLNAKTYSSDGYMALPVTALGKEYYHLSYWDFNEVREWGAGFLIVAIENNTKVTIRLDGRGKGRGKTVKGRDIGDVIRITLHEGQTYMVRGDGTTRGVFDLSGSRVLANKPVGFFSFHMRAIIPVFDIYNGRDYLVEMLPPVHAWGKKYVTVEYKRDTDQGDFFRIIASEDDTKFKCTYYDKDDGSVLGNWEGTLKRAGDWEDYLEVFTKEGNKLKSIRGTSVWTADKPVLLMQYSYSALWDNANMFDPFMIVVTAEEQFISNSIFQTPSKKGFVTNWFNIVAVHDEEDPKFNDLKSIKIDGVPIIHMEPRFIYNKIPTTNMYWAKISVNPGPHRIYGDGKVKFGGYIYGFSQWDSYGWPAVTAINKIDETDTLPPLLNAHGDCTDYIVEAIELRNGHPDDSPRQVDQGIVNIELQDGSYNYELTILNPNPFKTYPPVYKAEFNLKVIDKAKDALAIFSVTDRYGNFVLDTVKCFADSTQRIIDTLPPLLSRTGSKGEYFVEATELRNGQDGDNPKQVDSGIYEISLLNRSFNFNLKIIAPDPFNPDPPVYVSDFTVKVKDKTKNGEVFYVVKDKAGNTAIDSVFYKGELPDDVVDRLEPSDKLFDIDPNPVTGKNIILKFTLLHSEQIHLELFGNNGELVASLFKGRKDAGLHTLTFPTDNLTSGVYLLRLSSDRFIETKSFVFVK